MSGRPTPATGAVVMSAPAAERAAPLINGPRA
jgi:hypothetical protein